MIIRCQTCQSSFRIDQRNLKSIGSKVRCSKCQQVFWAFPPEQVNRREHPRIQTRNLISYLSLDEQGSPISQGLSKAIDISRGGILLETPHPIESGMISLMAVGMDNNFIEIKGELVYNKKTDSGVYHSGIEFIGPDNQVKKFVVALIKEYNKRKNNLCFSLDP